MFVFTYRLPHAISQSSLAPATVATVAYIRKTRLMSSLYQRAIFDVPSSSTNAPTTHVRLTSARPFAPEFVQRHLNSKSRARKLYDERVRRRQLILAPKPPPRPRPRPPTIPNNDARMGRREAVEKGLWRLRADEAKCVPCTRACRTFS
jgi:hypothetical protein